MCGIFLVPTNSPTFQPSTGCSTVQFNSDTNYPEFAQTHRQGLIPTRLPPFQIPAATPRPPLLLTNWLKIEGSHDFLLRLANFLEELTELRKTLHLQLLVCYKGCNSGTTKWRRCIGQGMGREGV